MVAYYVKYTVRGKEQDRWLDASVDARDLKSAKKKLGKKHGYKDGRMITIRDVSVIGYY